MIKFIIVIGRKYFSNYLAQAITEFFKKILAVFLKITLNQKNLANFLKHRNDFCD